MKLKKKLMMKNCLIQFRLKTNIRKKKKICCTQRKTQTNSRYSQGFYAFHFKRKNQSLDNHKLMRENKKMSRSLLINQFFFVIRIHFLRFIHSFLSRLHGHPKIYELVN